MICFIHSETVLLSDHERDWLIKEKNNSKIITLVTVALIHKC